MIAMMLPLLVGLSAVPGGEAACPEGFVRAPAGAYTRGNPAEEQGLSEWAPRPARVSYDFCVKATEVTYGEWRAAMRLVPTEMPQGCDDRCPISGVTWLEAVAYANRLSEREGLPACYALKGCQGLPGGPAYSCEEVAFAGLSCPGYRLPTDTEWEYAARAGSNERQFRDEAGWPAPPDDKKKTEKAKKDDPPDPVQGLPSVDTAAWHHTGGARYRAVGSLAPNAWGLYDVLGNVGEWVTDDGDRACFTETPEDDPLCLAAPGERPRHYFRGGYSFEPSLSFGRRYDWRASEPRDDRIGFRVVRRLPAP
ncbi:formylglycine-generating enzyme family protein [Myxococcota bacterium]|nr:formylglycine-generating enzyme family protein [Myxococcota bacterium]